jgi:hypothetical protein
MHDKTMKEPREALLIALKKLEVPVNRGAPRQPVGRFRRVGLPIQVWIVRVLH